MGRTSCTASSPQPLMLVNAALIGTQAGEGGSEVGRGCFRGEAREGVAQTQDSGGGTCHILSPHLRSENH